MGKDHDNRVEFERQSFSTVQGLLGLNDPDKPNQLIPDPRGTLELQGRRSSTLVLDEPEKFITILELPIVIDAQSAVKVGVSYQIKKARAK